MTAAPQTQQPDSWSQALLLIDELLAEVTQSKMTIAALVREIATLRGHIADMDGKLAAALGGVR